MRKKLTEWEIIKFFRTLMETVNYIHQKNIVHRDIKPENILFDEANNLKLVDFGSAQILEQNSALIEPAGTMFYIAPEVLIGEYDFKCDIWSCGVILYILLTGQLPFTGDFEEL